MKFALIKDTIVTQVQPNEQAGFIEVKDDVIPGMIYVGEDNYFNPPETAEQAEHKAIEQMKYDLGHITVTTSLGNVFDGDDVARADMMSAISAGETLGQASVNWKLADNTWKTIGTSEMKEAQALAISRKGEILAGSI